MREREGRYEINRPWPVIRESGLRHPRNEITAVSPSKAAAAAAATAGTRDTVSSSRLPPKKSRSARARRRTRDRGKVGHENRGVPDLGGVAVVEV